MIYALHKFLKRKEYAFPGRFERFQIILIFLSGLYILKYIQFILLIELVIPLAILRTGVLNTPYLFLKNTTKIFINKKITKKIFFKLQDRTVSFLTDNEDWLGRRADGLIIGNQVYVDKQVEESYWSGNYAIKNLKRFYEINYSEGLIPFIEKLNTNDLDTIKKKLLFKEL